MGRAARNVNGKVIMYADQVTPAMRNAIEETERRRVKQTAYNLEHNITPQTIQKAVRRGLAAELRARKTAREAVRTQEPEFEIDELIKDMETEMLEAAKELSFEKAAMIRDQVMKLRRRKEEAARTGGSTKARRSDVESSGGRGGGRGGRQRSEGKAGMPGIRSTRRRKG
jgi:excinuclease ABC subunit B